MQVYLSNWLASGLIWAGWLAGGYGVLQAWRAVAPTSLHQARRWWCLAWVGWGAAFAAALAPDWERPLTYLALVLTAAGGVAVLGAKEPGLRAWNLVLVGLIATLSLPLIEQRWLSETWRLDTTWTLFLAALLGALALNHLLTCWTWPVLAALISCGWKLLWLWLPREWGSLEGPLNTISSLMLVMALIVVPVWSRHTVVSMQPLDLTWLRFRDYFGMVWGLRVRDQFNAAAENSGLTARLTWWGLRGLAANEADRVTVLLDKVLRPFRRGA